jgi:carboxypeptidase T
VTYRIGMTPSGELRRDTAGLHPAPMDERPRAPHASSDVPRHLARSGLLALAGAALLLIGGTLTATIAAAAEPNFPAKDSRYHNYPEMVAEIQAVAKAHPNIVRVFSIGKSYEGRDLWAAKISDNVNVDEHEPEVLFDALHHAREHMTVEQALYLYRMLANDYSKYSTIRNLVNSEEIFIIFALNPDGFRYDLTGSPYRAWRKNRQPNAGTSAVGTDLNRNYDYRFACCGGSSGNPSSITYRGSKAFSAPETQAFRDFVNGRVENGIQQITEHITLHTNGELILWPFGYTKTNIPADMTRNDWTTFVKLGRGMAARNGYTPQQSSDLYITDGDFNDWMYGELHRYPITIEISGYGFGFYPPDEYIPIEARRDWRAALFDAKIADCPRRIVGGSCS